MPPDLEKAIRHPAGADLARVLAIGVVAWFHIWQQSWVTPARPFDVLPRTGYVWVDLMILLSAFCLALPYGADRAKGAGFRGTEGFWTRRAVRILPCYYLCAGVHLAVSLARQGVGQGFWKDLLGHLTLTHTFMPESYWYTQMGGALWTVGVLAGFYLLFPAIIRAFWHRPGLTLTLLGAVQLGWTLWAKNREGLAYQMAFNQLPAFAGVLGLGFALALLYPRLALLLKGRLRPVFLLGAGGMLAVITGCLRVWFLHGKNPQLAQLLYRMPLCFLFMVLLLFLCLGLGESRKGGALALLSAISYNFYLWHQSIAVWLKDLHIPHWEGEKPPNMTGDTVWMHRYQLLCWLAAFAAALAGTYFVERPLARALLKKKKQKAVLP